MNDVNSWKSVMPYSSVGRFCACSNTVSRMVPVKDLESMAWNALEFCIAQSSVQTVNVTLMLVEEIN